MKQMIKHYLAISQKISKDQSFLLLLLFKEMKIYRLPITYKYNDLGVFFLLYFELASTKVSLEFSRPFGYISNNIVQSNPIEEYDDQNTEESENNPKEKLFSDSSV